MSQQEIGLFLEGLRCAGCVRRLEAELSATPGVHEVAVSLARERARIAFDPARLSPQALVERVGALGYGARPYDPEAIERPAQAQVRAALVRLLVAGFLAANTMSIALALYLGSTSGIDPDLRRAFRLVAIALAVPSVTWCAAPFWRGALADLRARRLGMDVPVVLGVSVSFAASIAGTAAEVTHVFADPAPTIVFLLLLGRTLERRARARGASAVERLLTAVPPRALRRTAAGIEEIDSSWLVPGDRVVVPPGAACPADGCIAQGSSELDESLLTGESRPVPRGPGDEVKGGTRNLTRELEVDVLAAVTAGTLARLAALLERSQLSRPTLQRSADRVASFFAPVVLVGAAVAGIGWWWAGRTPLEALLIASSVGIVACPCALGLATPVAVVAAIGRAAVLGIVVKSGEALERCARVDTVLLDKTGTLTCGRPALRALVPAAGETDKDVLRAAVAAEGSSTHPIADAIRRAAQERGIAPETAQTRTALPGHGVRALASTSTLRAGTRIWLESEGCALAAALRERADREEERGCTQVFVARGDRVIGLLLLEDLPRADARIALARLHALGLRCAMVTGDHAGAAGTVARSAGLTDVASRITPEGKVERVHAEQALGARVLMAGDGINDAAALAAADAGVAFARGSDLALHACDVVIVTERLGALADLVELSRAALRRIRQGLAIAIVYNAVAVPLAVAGVLEPLGAALAMSASSLAVTLNAVRLARWSPRP